MWHRHLVLSIIALSFFSVLNAKKDEQLLNIINHVMRCELSSVEICHDDMLTYMETLVREQSDGLKGKVHLAKGIIYKNIGDYGCAVSELKAAKSFLFHEYDIDNYILSVLCLAEIFVESGQYDSALFQIEMLHDNYDGFSKVQQAFYSDICLSLSMHYKYFGCEYINKYLHDVDEDYVNWGLVMKALLRCSESSRTVDVYNKPVKAGRFVSELDAIFLNTIRRNESDHLGNLPIDFLDIIGIIRPFDFGSVAAIKEVEKKINQQDRDRRIIYLILCLTIIFVSVLIVNYKTKNEYLEEITVLQNERERERRVRRRLQLSSDVLRRVDERLRLLDNYILATMSGNYIGQADYRLKKYMEDRDHFLQSTVDSYLIAHPQFVRYLREQNLSDAEVAYCCMYVSGFKGKAIASYLGWKRGYDKSAELRKKLNIKGCNVNLDTFLMSKLSEFNL